MMLWPRIEAASDEPAPSGLWGGFSAASPEASDAPPVDFASLPVAAAASPPLEPAAPRSGPSRAKGRTRLLAGLALLVSTGLHAAVLAFFLDRLSQAGVEAETDSVSVEIVLDTPPAPTVAASGGTPSEAPPEPEKTAETSVPEPAQDAAEPPLEIRSAEPPGVAQSEAERAEDMAEEAVPATEEAVAEPSPAKPPVAQAPVEPVVVMPRDPVAELTPPLPAAPPPENTLAEARTPETDPPVPSPRPAYTPPTQSKPEAAATARAEPAKPAKAKASKPAPAKAAKSETSGQKKPASASAAGSAGAKGGASAGAAAKYGQRLLSHVERHKRYPQAAARQQITGATRLAITIDRSGKLAGARVAGGSGHAILDEEAIAVARRAAPYPRPPDGVGGGTISFSVTLRFKR